MATVLVAPDSFKGTFSAVEVAEAIGRGLRAAGLECDLCPVADGGEGTMETLLASIGGEVVEVDGVLDPLRRPRRAPFALIEGGARAMGGAGGGAPARSSRWRQRAGWGSWPRTSATPGRRRRTAPASSSMPRRRRGPRGAWGRGGGGGGPTA